MQVPESEERSFQNFHFRPKMFDLFSTQRRKAGTPEPKRFTEAHKGNEGHKEANRGIRQIRGTRGPRECDRGPVAVRKPRREAYGARVPMRRDRFRKFSQDNNAGKPAHSIRSARFAAPQARRFTDDSIFKERELSF